ncbi:nitrous oxide reductase accessory protein NosL [Mesobacillus subterraneus]|uniref:nitrous oxide reductase accessory protein NosL n=1 Tax=Mesobacillus subterraneus TaxID=285983 RepID=UPI00273EF66B|nr:nitrous oxide reductase accessory protein NosL [Mesobacillus subterraneus]WLR54254.1 nitrous oxide reductase accessory protein NosL [Mesobacillus subterraneus]
MIKKLGILLMMSVGVLAGCSNSAMEPEEINPEIDVCEVCNMGLAHEHYATEVVTTDGEIYKFDDIGCMEEFMEMETDLKEESASKKYVRDVDSGEWIELDKAYYAYHKEFWTPMANGVISFKDRESAEKYVKEQGMGEVLLDYESLKEHVWSWEQ